MNRIVLIGNGFDLAHGLKTSYRDFKDFIEVKNNEMFFENWNSRYLDCVFYSYSTKYQNFGTLCNDTLGLKRQIENETIIKKYTNIFYLDIVNHLTDLNWVDIEHLYFEKLIACNNLEEATILNSQFDEIKTNFENYLWEEVQGEISINIRQQEIKNQFFSDFKFNEISFSYIENVTAEFTKFKKDNYYKVNPLNETKDFISKNKKWLESDKILFLNFNYTNLESLYAVSKEGFKEVDIIHIHGELNNKKYPIVFGFGDEYGKEYTDLELKYQNEYFKNIKSFMYLENTNYRNLLQFMNSGKYQVCIFGHSCGHSDRTLLKTLFENDNCVSIKPYYRIKNDSSDNYFDIVGNISRNFSNKMEMRDKVVNKQYCEPFIIER